MRRCFPPEPQPPSFTQPRDIEHLAKLKPYSLATLQIALSRGAPAGGAHIDVGHGKVTRDVLLRHVSFLEEHRDWRTQRQSCLLMLFTGLTAFFTLLIAIGTFMLD